MFFKNILKLFKGMNNFGPKYTYIYCRPQTDCFDLSELFSVARHVGRSKPGSKATKLYVRLNLRPLGQQAYHVR